MWLRGSSGSGALRGLHSGLGQGRGLIWRLNQGGATFPWSWAGVLPHKLLDPGPQFHQRLLFCVLLIVGKSLGAAQTQEVSCRPRTPATEGHWAPALKLPTLLAVDLG